MKTIIAAAAIAMVGSSALAADLPARTYTKAPVAAPVASYNWTGFYIGAGGGYEMWNQDNTVLTPAGVVLGATATAGGRGWFGTVQVGADYQVAPSWVIGAFADYDFTNAKGQVASAAGLLGTEKLRSKWAAGARLGYVPFNNLLAYVSGGYTEARFNAISFTGPLGGAVIDTTGARTLHGWFLGTGYEYGMSFLPGLFWKTEYRFSQFNNNSALVAAVPGGATVATFNSKTYDQAIRTELVYRFNWGGAVTARY